VSTVQCIVEFVYVAEAMLTAEDLRHRNYSVICL